MLVKGFGDVAELLPEPQIDEGKILSIKTVISDNVAVNSTGSIESTSTMGRPGEARYHEDDLAEALLVSETVTRDEELNTTADSKDVLLPSEIAASQTDDSMILSARTQGFGDRDDIGKIDSDKSVTELCDQQPCQSADTQIDNRPPQSETMGRAVNDAPILSNEIRSSERQTSGEIAESRANFQLVTSMLLSGTAPHFESEAVESKERENVKSSCLEPGSLSGDTMKGLLDDIQAGNGTVVSLAASSRNINETNSKKNVVEAYHGYEESNAQPGISVHNILCLSKAYPTIDDKDTVSIECPGSTEQKTDDFTKPRQSTKDGLPFLEVTAFIQSEKKNFEIDDGLIFTEPGRVESEVAVSEKGENSESHVQTVLSGNQIGEKDVDMLQTDILSGEKVNLSSEFDNVGHEPRFNMQSQAHKDDDMGMKEVVPFVSNSESKVLCNDSDGEMQMTNGEKFQNSQPDDELTQNNREKDNISPLFHNELRNSKEIITENCTVSNTSSGSPLLFSETSAKSGLAGQIQGIQFSPPTFPAGKLEKKSLNNNYVIHYFLGHDCTFVKLLKHVEFCRMPS